MINKNFMSLVTIAIDYTNSQTFKTVYGTFDSKITNYGVFYALFGTNAPNNTNSNYSKTAGTQLLLGAGNTPPTVDDYKLESIVTGYNVIAQSKMVATATYTTTPYVITRTIECGDVPITISEMALIGNRYDVSNDEDNNVSIMIAREVLDKPVTLQPGETYTFTMTISLKVPDTK